MLRAAIALLGLRLPKLRDVFPYSTTNKNITAFCKENRLHRQDIKS